MRIIVPSAGRAGQMLTHKVFKVDAVYVPMAEVKDYQTAYPDLTIAGVPDEIKGITKTRNFMLNAETDKHLIQVDDDVEYFFMFENAQVLKIEDWGRIKLLLENMFIMAEEIGANLWGLQLANDPRFYREYSPFSLTSICVANLFGMINDGQRFDERFIVKEDYDYSIMSLYKHRKILKFQKFGVKVQHLTNEGGCVAYRTREVEEEAFQLLKKKWGSRVVKRQGNKNFVRVHIPIRGI